MDGGTWFISILLFVTSLALIALSFVPYYARYSVLRYAQRLELRLPSHLEGVMGRRLMARMRAGAIGAAVFVAASSAALAWLVEPDIRSNLVGLLVIGAAFVGIGVGTAVAALAASSSVAPDQPRVARAGAVAVKDYLAPVELVGARVVVAGAVLLLVWVTVFTSRYASVDYVGITMFSVFGVLSLVLFEVASRRIVDQSQPAGSTAELVWDDAIRASALRDLVTAPLALGVYSLLFGFVSVADANGDVVFGLLGGIVFVALLAAAIVSRVTRTQSYFVRRLWPDLRWSDTADATTDAA